MKQLGIFLLMIVLVSCREECEEQEVWCTRDMVENHPSIEIYGHFTPTTLYVDITNQGLYVEDSLFHIDNLANEVYIFLTNYGKNPNYSDSYDDSIVKVNVQDDVKYGTYSRVVSELKTGFIKVREEVSMQRHGVTLAKLKRSFPEEYRKIRREFPIKIAQNDDVPSIRFQYPPPPPPPPPIR